MEEELLTLTPEMQMLNLNRLSGYSYRERRHADWDENYLLYRDKVQINRLTQRQSVHVPLMKQQIRSLLKDVDDMPVLYFENLDNDKDAEIFKNEYWKYTAEQNKMELQDIVDKRQVFLFGRSYDQWQIVDGKIKMTVIDPMDILIDRYVDPFDIHSARFLIHMHIFKPLSMLERNPDYDQEAIKELKEFYATTEGLKKAAQNEQALNDKNQKMADMGVSDVDQPILGETLVELSLHFVYLAGEKDAEGNEIDEQIFLFVEADGMKILMKKPLEEVIGVTTDHYWRNHFPYNSWADDLERQDWFSDGVGDIIRGANKVADVWWSQIVENRTLRSMGMQYYDASEEGFQPQTYQPMPFGWYGVPGNPKEKVQRVDIPELSEAMDEMNFVIQMAEKASGATATQQGQQTERTITLGEVQLALGEAKERIKGMSKFYTPAWMQRGQMFSKLIEAAPDKLDAVKVYKKGKITNNIYSREIAPKDWMTKSGYRCKVWSQSEKDQQDNMRLQKIDLVSANMPDNPVVQEEKQRKMLEFAGFNPDQINAAMEFEQAKREAMLSMVGQGIETPGMPVAPDAQPKSLPAPRPGIPAQL